ncbi:hypothetical protein FRC01_013874 [Tulasnella sp. 417]|nr:hypothetical protein FRC01_013874 [Tulasnella sp. 417]
MANTSTAEQLVTMDIDQSTAAPESSPEKASSTPTSRLDIQEPFETFPAATVIDEYVAQEEGEEDFIKDVMREMFDVMLEFKIWSECRPKAEIEQFANAMDDKLKVIEEKEQEQGMSLLERARQNLVAFVASIQSALAALRNL